MRRRRLLRFLSVRGYFLGFSSTPGVSWPRARPESLLTYFIARTLNNAYYIRNIKKKCCLNKNCISLVNINSSENKSLLKLLSVALFLLAAAVRAVRAVRAVIDMDTVQGNLSI